MRSEAEVQLVLELSAGGMSASEIARRTGISRSTVKDWVAGRLPRTANRLVGGEACLCEACGSGLHDFAGLPPSYTYLLGMYLGDGCISMHRRAVARLRIHLDAKYPRIIEETRSAISDLVPGNRIHEQRQRSNYTDSPELTTVIVSAYSKTWPCWFPQHGPGKKHERRIELVDWQRRAVGANPGGFLRGLIHSDGCRFINTGTNWSNPRYSFSNQSEDIKKLFVDACELLQLHTTRAPNTVYVSRKRDVKALDVHVGPKR